MEAFIGTILPVAFAWAPRGWTACNGQLLPIQQSQALFALVSFTYGGDGRTTFGVPDLRGRTPFGVGQGPGLTNNSPIGAAVGTDTTTLSLANMPAHTHAATFAPTSGTKDITIPGKTGDLAVTMNALTSGASTAAVPTSSLMLAAGQKIFGPAPAVPATPPPAGTIPLAPASISVTGTPTTLDRTVSINTVTGGTVTNAVAGAGQSFSNMQPSLALNFIIALEGLYPNRP